MALIADMAPLPAQSQIAGFDKTLRARATIKDIFVNLQGLFDRTEQTIPNAIYMKVDGTSPGTNNVTITMKLPLIEPAVLGNTRLTGNEEEPSTKAATIYRNNYKKAVVVEDYGVRKLDQQDYGLYKKHIKDLGLWASQFEGYEIRHALLERYSSNLAVGDTSASCVPEWHPHMYVQGATDAQQPTYSTDLTTYTNNIVGAIVNASDASFTASAAQAMTFRMMNKLAEKALDEKIFPLQIGGNDAYILTVSTLQAQIFSDPLWSANTGGAVWVGYNRLSEKTQNWYNVLGCFKSSIGVDIYVVVDHKCPTVRPGGSAGAYTLVAGYMKPGDVDDRNRSNAVTRDVGFLLGKTALCKWEPEPLHFVKQDDDYFRVMGHGIAGVRGIQQVHFDQQTPAAGSMEYYGSIGVIFARPTYN